MVHVMRYSNIMSSLKDSYFIGIVLYFRIETGSTPGRSNLITTDNWIESRGIRCRYPVIRIW